MSTVILGGGIIGLSTAYYLSLSNTSQHHITIIDPSPRLLASASGFAGGFLARDWFDSPAAALGALSYDLHRQLADDYNGRERWGYSESTALSLAINPVRREKTKKGARGRDWLQQGTSRSEAAAGVSTPVTNCNGPQDVLNEDGTPRWYKPQPGGTVETISSPEGCAQVEPFQLCQFLLSECERRGVDVKLSTRATEVVRDDKGRISALKTELVPGNQDGDLQGHSPAQSQPCTHLVLAAGAWIPQVFTTLFPTSKIRVPVTPLAGHSCVLRSRHFPQHASGNLVAAAGQHLHHAIFSAPSPSWPSFAPEAISRVGRDGRTSEVFVAGLNSSSMPLPTLATEGKVDEESRRELRRVVRVFMGLESEEELERDVVREAVCWRPATTAGVVAPVVGEVQAGVGGGVQEEKEEQEGKGSGVWIASGHGPWGISLSLGTGLVVSEMIRGVKTSVDVKELGWC